MNSSSHIYNTTHAYYIQRVHPCLHLTYTINRAITVLKTKGVGDVRLGARVFLRSSCQ